jgi:hypothetical protein
MLVLPQIGMASSVEPEHNVELDALCDWIEASLAFTNLDFISDSNIVDVLIEEEIYENQEFAWELVDNAFAELRRRCECLSASSPFEIKSDRIMRIKDWENVPAYAFCLTLACAKWYPNWASCLVKPGKKRPDYSEQGQLFEQITASALQKLFPGWKVLLTGWSPNKPDKIKKVVEKVATFLREPAKELQPWMSPEANEAGLDIVCCRHFNDGRAGLPTVFVQCASGKHAEHKLKTPDEKEWGKVIEFTAVFPQRSFATPFVFTDDEFKRVANKVDGLLLDRVRLLSAGNDGVAWLSESLNKHLNEWVTPRVAKLQRAA